MAGGLRAASTSPTRPIPSFDTPSDSGLGPSLIPFSAYLACMGRLVLAAASGAVPPDEDRAGLRGALPSSQARPGLGRAYRPEERARAAARSDPVSLYGNRESVANGPPRIRVTQSPGVGGLISSRVLSGVG